MTNKIGLAAAIALAGCSISLKGKDDAHSRALSTQDEGSTGVLHDNNRDKIVFAKSEIPRGGGSASDQETTFRADEPIWSRYYLSKSLAKHVATQADPSNACKWENRHRLNVFAKVGSLNELHYREAIPGEKNWGFWTTAQATGDAKPLLPEQSVFLPQDRDKDGAPLLLALATLPDGSYPVAMRVQAGCITGPHVDVAIGEFTVVVDQEARDTLIARLRLAEPMYKDTTEVSRLQSAAAAIFSDGTVKDFRVLDPAWRVTRNEVGTPLQRNVNALTFFQKDDECTLIGSEITEENEGGGSYGEPVFLQSHDARLKALKVPCSLSSSP